MYSALTRLCLYIDGYDWTFPRFLSFIFLFYIYKIFKEKKEKLFALKENSEEIKEYLILHRDKETGLDKKR